MMMMIGLKHLAGGDELVAAQLDSKDGYIVVKGVFRVSGKCDGMVILSDWIIGMDRYQVLKLDEKSFVRFPPSRSAIEAYRKLVEVKSEDKGNS